MANPVQRSVGKPRKWQSPDDLRLLIDNYLQNTPVEDWSVTGLALTCGASRQLLIDYEKLPEFKDLLSEAKLMIEHAYELSLRKNGRVGDIFALKNLGWRDKTETETNINVKFSLADLHGQIETAKSTVELIDQ